MPPPPPPPPGPPPPPAPAKAMPQLGGGGGGGGDRSNLLKDIRGGTRLKKVVTNDRSAPVTGAVRKTSPTEPNRFNGGGGGSASGSATSPAEPPRLPGIGGLFAGGFPQLKKAGDRDQPPRRPAAPPGKSNHTHVLLTNFRLFFSRTL